MTANPINHVIVLMMENRSFDHVLGSLAATRPGLVGIPSPPGSNRANDGTAIEQTPIDDLPCNYNLPHFRHNVLAQYAGGALSGFVTEFENAAPGQPLRVPMGYYTEKTLPVLYALAERFTICDSWHCSMLSSTWPNRKYFHSGKRDADDDTQLLPGFPGFRTTPLYEQLEKTRNPDDPSGASFLTWRCYFSDLPFLAFWYGFAATHLARFSSVLEFVADCRAGTLPNVAIVDPPFSLADDHPPHDPMLGEKFIGLIVDALTTSKSWDDSALLIVYDENGGFYDHVPPPPATPPNETGDTPYGFRVPALLVSPYSARGAISHTLYDHTSFMRSVAERWGVTFDPATYGTRFTTANSFWDAFDFTAKPAPRGTYTGIGGDSVVAAMNWGSGVYARLSDEVTKFETLLDRIFVLPELKALDQRAKVFDLLNAFEHEVVTQKRMLSYAPKP